MPSKKIVVGDIVAGKPGAPYGITNEKMTRAAVVAVYGELIALKIINHDCGETGRYDVDAKYFKIVGHVKPFNRAEFYKSLKNGNKNAIFEYNLSGADLSGADLSGADLREADLSGADLSEADLSEADLREANLREADLSEADLSGADLRGANLSEANLRGADIDFSCWPLWCGSLHAKIDKRLACQLAYHLCSIQCDDAEFLKMRNSILGFANQFRGVCECGILEPISTAEDDNEHH